ncbi:MAG: Rpn family recombination-promoting nuclease/putative transposase [Agathobacter sp.]|nr:Rpn family recombination-promoting nuclease/putative transposase [Agathobacter sp.]
MEKDKQWIKFLEDNVRYSDIINGFGCGGEQIISPSDLTELDTRENGKYRDTLRKIAFGVGFAIVGIENQETVDYSLPIRIMDYDSGCYRKQKSKIARRNRRKFKRSKGLLSDFESSEFLYGFLKSDKVYPVVTFVLYAGKEEWVGPKCLHDIIDFRGIPDKIIELVENYRIHIVDIRRVKDTTVFKSDVKQVFDFLKCSEDKRALLDLIQKDSYYKNMDVDAYALVKSYTNISKTLKIEDYRMEGGIDVCKAINDLIIDSREEGREEGVLETQKIIILNMLKQNVPTETICLFTGCNKEFVNEIKSGVVA